MTEEQRKRRQKLDRERQKAYRDAGKDFKPASAAPLTTKNLIHKSPEQIIRYWNRLDV